MKRRAVIAALSLVAAVVVAKEEATFGILKSTARIGKQDNGVFLLTSNQLLRPWGQMTMLAGRPVDSAMDSRKQFLAVLNTRAVELLDAATGVKFGEMKLRSSSYTGVAFRPGSSELWVSETTRTGPDAIVIGAIDATGKLSQAAKIDLPGHPLPAGIAFDANGKVAYVALSRNNSVAVVDAAARKVVRELETGMAPFAVVRSGKLGKVFVSNRAGRRPKAGETVAPSSGSDVAVDPNTGATSTGTITVIDEATSKTQEITVGLAPSLMSLSADESTLAVANGHSDTVSLIDTKTLKRSDLAIPSWPDNLLGSQPVDARFSPDGKQLYIACGGTNAIVVARKHGNAWRVDGAVPTAWFPSSISVAVDGSLRVVAIKGTGNTADKKGTFNSRQYEGALSRIPAPLPSQLAAGTREVKASNMPRFEAAGGVTNIATLGIQHVIFIIKENRTYDQVFGDMGKGDSDPKLVMYGREITPNHHALAEKYVLIDNFHTGGAISFDGHHWLMQAFVSDYVERAFAASPRGYAYNMADAMTVSPAGFFWQSASKPLDVRLYGELCTAARWDPRKDTIVDINERDERSWSEYWRLYKEGKWQDAVGCRCAVPALAKFSSTRFPHATLAIPDQIRAEEWLREFREREESGMLPQISIINLNDDHTSGTRPGRPTPRASVADNDLALGRIVDAVSKSKFWPRTLILVTEDDAQDGVDHVDGHRTIALAIGPNVRQGAVDSTHYNHTSMVRTIQEVFGVPARTRNLASARPMTTVLTTKPDPSSYDHIVPKVPLDEMNPSPQALSGRQLWAARESLKMNFSDLDDIPAPTLNRILWWDAKGWNTPYPGK
ncbi:MAG: bifunctional YncE family protein/alkaline phosphatase family protein [Candidatus Solibacter usitatus]|nr:bifunctional YncE family protein/alkaline phosphatase family protein [Candidatus Solibacter usitatus]